MSDQLDEEKIKNPNQSFNMWAPPPPRFAPTPPPPPAPPSAAPTPSGVPAGIPTELWTALQSYKANYAAYKVSGQTAHKTAYESALAIVNQAIAKLAESTETNNSKIQGFLASYSSTNKDITDLQTQSRAIKTQGPALQDELLKSQKFHEHAVSVADDTSLYVKSAIVVGLLVIVGIAGVL